MPDAKSAPLSTKRKVTTLYALGSNGNHQLGLPHKEDINIPQRCIFHNTTSTSSKSIPTSTSPHQQAPPPPLSTSNTSQTQPHIPLQQDETIKDLKAGGNHTLLLTTHSRVFAAGSNEYGQLGILPLDALACPSSSIPDTPARVNVNTENDTSSSSPAKSPNPGFHLLPWTGPPPRRPITNIAATFTATHFLASHTTLFTCGFGPKGELGLGPSATQSQIPQLAFDIRDVEGPDARIEMMAACMDHVLLLSRGGMVYGVGSGRKGQLGGESKVGIHWTVKVTDIHSQVPFKISQVVTGRDFSVVAGRGRRYMRAFGRGSGRFNEMFTLQKQQDVTSLSTSKEQEYSQTNTNDYDSVKEGESEPQNETVNLHAGWSSLTIHHHGGPCDSVSGLFMNDTATINDRGQLPPLSLPRLTTIVVGSEHTVALVRDGKVVSWGWGEHGNCGVEVDERGSVGGGRWNVLFDGSQRSGGKSGSKGVVIGVGAGCGSTFLWDEEEIEEEDVRVT